MSTTDQPGRCPWCGTDPLYVSYHDTEWGVPEFDSRALWEKLILDGFQAGLAWITILRKREAFRTAFAGFRPDIIAGWGEADVSRLLQDAGIVRHRGKIEGTIRSAQAFMQIEERTPFSEFLWRHLDGQPLVNHFRSPSEVPIETAVSKQISKELKAQGFTFCGPTIVYAFMQATGMVNDHLVTCHRHPSFAALAK
ncbi:DNA-3-methyladenine glycosylase I [Neotabrizicola shimadae]|uniref:DNA-3-methyladenine glycosylase I n=1 Tax=Neotabrizicola shimadae TaxID=2807096 RepID=A0A8G1EB43_9RHOB|nr:DNA-3-methyladenine glycosylase I [Neotabrizicola shimadae]QYZ68997.1 DNA-3-methyladenine glycosylase I [Neotabrizicola shimadae]